LAPQPTVEVVDGFLCRYCDYKTQDRSNMKKHGNKAHGKQRAKDEELFRAVRLQSWFQDSRQRYWVVDERGGRGLQEPSGVQVKEEHGKVEIADSQEAVDASQEEADEDSQEEVDDQIQRELGL